MQLKWKEVNNSHNLSSDILTYEMPTQNINTYTFIEQQMKLMLNCAQCQRNFQ